jgi:hypothetical protein
MKLKVQDHPGLYRDSKSKAIVREDPESFSRYMAEKRYRQTITDSNRGLEDQINNLKTELEHLKDLVHKLIKDR